MQHVRFAVQSWCTGVSVNRGAAGTDAAEQFRPQVLFEIPAGLFVLASKIPPFATPQSATIRHIDTIASHSANWHLLLLLHACIVAPGEWRRSYATTEAGQKTIQIAYTPYLCAAHEATIAALSIKRA